MAAAFPATFRRAVLFGTRSCVPNRFGYRAMSDLVETSGKCFILVDTLALVRKLEKKGVPSDQAEALTEEWVDVVNNSLQKITPYLVSKDDLQKMSMIFDSNLSKFKTEVTSSQEHRLSLLQHELEKHRSDIEKMRSELRYEIDKVTAGQRLDINLEKGRTRDELNNQSQVTCNLTNKLDKEIQEVRAQFEAGKYDVIKYCIGALTSISAVGLAALRILL